MPGLHRRSLDRHASAEPAAEDGRAGGCSVICQAKTNPLDWSQSAGFFIARNGVVLAGLFASKPAPTLDLRCTQPPCGSGLAREER
ncbi:hypothetical protein C1894_22575 [Pseudomonas sp. FW305-3-2-15-E-TSA2]|nr:hypothetical protein C1894_22575 [Pseudomonas sp. FW305-3-2-15-E-TSA2]